jgi:8-oxo-dGTP pyrophosphatase MutT (NUDIX family)
MEDNERNRSAALNLEMLLDAVRTAAQEGLHFSENPYDRERYKKLLDLACGQYASIMGLDAEAIRETFLKERGCITPKVGVDVVIPSAKGEILILQLPNGQWCLPGGFVDVGESPFDAARRETHEEAGLEIAPLGYIGVGHRTPLNYPGAISQINICVGAEPAPNDAVVTLSHEHCAYRWIADADDVDDWRPGHKRWFPHITRAYRDRVFFPVIDD